MTRLEIMVRLACTQWGVNGVANDIADFADELIAEDRRRTEASNTDRPAKEAKPCDPIIESNVRTLRERAAAGLKTYGTDLTRKDLTRDQWLEHLLHELLDAANYVTRLRTEEGKP